MPTALCPICRQQVETKDWWALWVPRPDTFVVHLVDGVPCEGSRKDVVESPADDSDGVPVPVETEESCAQTVRLERDPSIRDTGRGWADKLCEAA